MVDVREITLPAGRQSALCAPRTQPHRQALNRLSLSMARVDHSRKNGAIPDLSINYERGSLRDL